MKKLLFLSVSFLALQAGAQSDKYVKAMEDRISAMDTNRNLGGLTDLANAFERIADV